MKRVANVWGGVQRRFYAARADWQVRRASHLQHGPARVTLGAGDCAVVSLMKDAEYFVDVFIRHHLALGAAHIVIIDNGSSDRTVEIARGFDQVTVVQNPLPARQYECRLRAGVARQVVSGGWLLFVDSDELFEVPCAGARSAPLPRLISYLDQHGYTAMVTQMLDLFAPAPYAQTRAWPYPAAIDAMRSYSLNQITAVPYHDRDSIGFNWFLRGNICDNARVLLQSGGLRREIFGEACFLSKHSLVRNAPGIDPMPHPHCAAGVTVADVTGVLRHYKFSGAYLDRDRRSVEAGTWDHAEDRRRLERAGCRDDFAINCAEPQDYCGTETLVDQGFLTASPRYRAYFA
ncbi:MAG: glycosyltransferase family 2 protein [Paracoccaceae bacterium]|nr:glycosyltransferase family 2 protein [Paracoccaceae bacterium]